MTTLYRAALDTRHFAFEAYGDTEEAALYALHKGLERHCAQYRVNGPRFRNDYEESIEVRAIELGRAYRDREFIAMEDVR